MGRAKEDCQARSEGDKSAVRTGPIYRQAGRAEPTNQLFNVRALVRTSQWILCEVADCRRSNDNKWEYKLKHPDGGAPYKNGAWQRERDLHAEL